MPEREEPVGCPLFTSMATKICTKCNIEKGMGEFYKNRDMPSGYRNQCKVCVKEYSQKPEVKERVRKWSKKYNQKLGVKEQRRKYSQKYKQKLGVKERVRENRQKPEIKKQRRKRSKQRRVDPKFRILEGLDTILSRNRKYTKIKNPLTAKELLGCNPEYLWKYLEGRFYSGITWDNYGKWHIDHIRPISSFDSLETDIEQQKRCFHHSNLQPLWAADNIAKGAIYEPQT